MRRPDIITGLDIGSSKVSAVVTEAGGGGGLRIIAHATHPSKGISRGVIVGLDGAVDSVSKVLAKLADKAGKVFGDIHVNISNEAVKGSRFVGMVPLALRGREVTSADMDRCVNAASTIHLPFDREIIYRNVLSFSIDDQPPIKDPLGLYASRLNCEVYMITASANHIQNLYKCVNSAGYDIKEMVFTGVADAASLLESSQREEGAMLLDMGLALTEISIFYGGAMADLAIIPFDTQGVTANLRDDVELSYLVSKVSSKAEEFVKSGGKLSSVVITGGAAFKDGLIELFEAKLPYPVRMGSVKGMRGDISGIDSIRLATAMGLCRYAYEKRLRKASADKRLMARLTTKVVDIFNNYF